MVYHQLRLGIVHTTNLDYSYMPLAVRVELPKGPGFELTDKTRSTLSKVFGLRNVTARDYTDLGHSSYDDTAPDSHCSWPMSVSDTFLPSPTPTEVRLDV